MPIGISNFSFAKALLNQPDTHWGERFEAFVIPKEVDTFEHRSKPIEIDSHKAIGSQLAFQCPLCQHDGKIDPDCHLCDGEYELPVKTWAEFDEYIAKRNGGL